MVAKEFIEKKLYITQDGVESVHDSLENVSDVMVDFAKIHVTKALIEAVNSLQGENGAYQYANDILNCYPINDII